MPELAVRSIMRPNIMKSKKRMKKEIHIKEAEVTK